MSYTDFGDPGTSGDLADFFDTTGGASPDLSSLFGGTSLSSGSDLSSLLGSVGQAFAAGSAGGTGSPLAAADAVQQATDPTGSVAAQQAITGGQPAPTQNQTQNPQGQGQGQGQNANQYAPQSAIDALKKALTGLAQRQRQNPWQTGGPQNAADRAAGQNSPMLNRAGRIPTGAVPPAPAPAPFNPFDNSQGSQTASAADIPSANATPAEMIDMGEGGGRQAEYGWDIPPGSREGESNQNEYGDYKNPRQYPYPAEGESNENEYGPGYNPRQLPTIPPTPPSGGPPTPPSDGTPSGGAPPQITGPTTGPNLAGLAGLARMLGLGGAAGGAGFLLPFMTQPAETGVLPPYKGPSPQDWPESTGYPQTQLPTGPATIKAPDTGKPIKTVDPKTKKPVNPRTGEKLPTKKSDLPTHTGHYAPATGEARDKTWVPGDGHGPIMRDVSGVSTGAPTGLAQLAQMAMPLIMGALSGGFGGGRGRHGGFGRFGFVGRHGGFGGGRGGFGHPGGGGRWPYHHPNFGWAMHGGHPGGGWRPMSPMHMREIAGGGSPLAYGGGFSTGNPQLDQILQSLGIDTGQGGQRGQSGFGRQQGGGLGNYNYRDPPQGPWSSNPVMNTLVGAESQGDNSAVGDNGLATGVTQIQTPTWRQYAPNVPGASQYARAADAPIEVQLAVAREIPFSQWGPRTQAILKQKFGDIPGNMTIGQLADQQGGGGTQTASKPGATPTGGSASPNPQGNPADVDTTPAYVPPPTQMGAEAGAQG